MRCNQCSKLGCCPRDLREGVGGCSPTSAYSCGAFSGSSKALTDCYYVRAAVLHLVAARGSSTLGGSCNTASTTAKRLSLAMEEAGIDARQWVHELHELDRVGLVLFVEPEDVPERKAAWALTSRGSSAVCQLAGALQYLCEVHDDQEAA